MAHEITGRYAKVQNTRAYFDECGSDIPLICIHMGWACSLQWQYFMPIMADAGFHVIAPDLPGHAKSYPVNWTPFKKMYDYSEWVWNFIAAVCPEQKPVVCGSGIGGDMTLQIACNHPGGIRAGMVIESQWPHRATYQETCVADMDAWNDHDVRDKLQQITCPIFMFKGEADYHVPDQDVRDTMAAIPAGLAEGGIAKGMGHLIMMEDPQGLAAACLGFLRRRKII